MAAHEITLDQFKEEILKIIQKGTNIERLQQQQNKGKTFVLKIDKKTWESQRRLEAKLNTDSKDILSGKGFTTLQNTASSFSTSKGDLKIEEDYIELTTTSWTTLSRFRDTLLGKGSGSAVQLGHEESLALANYAELEQLLNTYKGTDLAQSEYYKELSKTVKYLRRAMDRVENANKMSLAWLGDKSKSKKVSDIINRPDVKDLAVNLALKSNTTADSNTIELIFESATINGKKGRLHGGILSALKSIVMKDFIDLTPLGKEITKLAGNIKSSPTLISKIEAQIDAVIDGKKVRSKATKASKPLNVDIYKDETKKKAAPSAAAVAQIKRQAQKVKQAATTSRLQDPRGRFTSLVDVTSMINALLHGQLKENMKPPALQYRTGRFASSVNVTQMNWTREGQITAFYEYMKRPYQTFERGFKQGSEFRDPRRLIDKSIREVAEMYIHKKFDLKTRRM